MTSSIRAVIVQCDVFMTGLAFLSCFLLPVSLVVWFCEGLAFMGAEVLEAFHQHRLALAVAVLSSILDKEVLKVAGSRVLMSFQCSLSMSRRLSFALNVISLILLMYPVCSISWARLWTDGIIVPRRTYMV